MKIINRAVYQVKKTVAAFKIWKTRRAYIDPEYIQYDEAQYKIKRIKDDLLTEAEKQADKKTYPYYIKKYTRAGSVKKEFYRTHEEAYEAMKGYLINRTCACIHKQ